MNRLILAICILSIALGGCALPADAQIQPMATLEAVAPALATQTPPTPQQAVSNVAVITPAPTTSASGGTGGLCGNPYYPVVDGATWVYDIQGLPQVVHTMSVEEENSFKVAVVNADSASILEGRCTEEGIVLMEMGMEGSFFTESGSSSISSLYQEGVTLPNDMQVGAAWSQATGINAEGEDSEVTLTATTITNYSVVGFESVTVPAGTFEALKIEQRATMMFYGQEIRTQGTLWYVAGIGNVMAESGLAGGEMYLIQLISYDIPQ